MRSTPTAARLSKRQTLVALAERVHHRRVGGAGARLIRLIGIRPGAVPSAGSAIGLNGPATPLALTYTPDDTPASSRTATQSRSGVAPWPRPSARRCRSAPRRSRRRTAPPRPASRPPPGRRCASKGLRMSPPRASSASAGPRRGGTRPSWRGSCPRPSTARRRRRSSPARSRGGCRCRSCRKTAVLAPTGSSSPVPTKTSSVAALAPKRTSRQPHASTFPSGRSIGGGVPVVVQPPSGRQDSPASSAEPDAAVGGRRVGAQAVARHLQVADAAGDARPSSPPGRCRTTDGPIGSQSAAGRVGHGPLAASAARRDRGRWRRRFFRLLATANAQRFAQLVGADRAALAGEEALPLAARPRLLASLPGGTAGQRRSVATSALRRARVGGDADVALLHLVRQVGQQRRLRRGEDRIVLPRRRRVAAREQLLLRERRDLRQAHLRRVDQHRADRAPTAPSPPGRARPSRARAASDFRGSTPQVALALPAGVHEQRQLHGLAGAHAQLVLGDDVGVRDRPRRRHLRRRGRCRRAGRARGRCRRRRSRRPCRRRGRARSRRRRSSRAGVVGARELAEADREARESASCGAPRASRRREPTRRIV